VTIIGIPLSLMMLTMLPRPARLRGGPEAAAINGALRTRVFANRFGLGNFILPWVVQLHSVGGGASRLVCRAPSTCGRKVLRPPVADFAWVGSVAQAAQRALAGRPTVPKCEPRFPLPYAELLEDGSRSPVAARQADATTQPSVVQGGLGAPAAPDDRRMLSLLRARIVVGALVSMLGLWMALAGVDMIVHPVSVEDVPSGWAGLIFSILVCVLPGVGLAAFTAWRMHTFRSRR
jgi:hypothetical protein